MADLIDRKKFRQEIESDFYWGNPFDYLDRIDAAPAVDAVEVVRCRDCEHFLQYTDHAGDCAIFHDEMETSGYCSFGKRKEAADNG